MKNPNSPKAIRKARGYMPGMNPTRRVAAPVTVRMATPEDMARMGKGVQA